MVNNLQQDQSQLLTVQSIDLLKQSASRVDTPLVLDNMKVVSSTPGVRRWASDRDPVNKVELETAYTAGDGVLVLKTDPLNDYSNHLIPGRTEFVTGSGTGRFVLKSFNATTNEATVEVAASYSDGNLAADTSFTISRHDDMTSDAHPGNDISFGSANYNYNSYFSYRMSLANDMKDNVIVTDVNEFTFEHQTEKQMPSVFLNFEVEGFFGPRRKGSGTAATLTPDGTIQGSDGQRAGGIITLGLQKNMYTEDLANKAPSLRFWSRLAHALRNRGAGRIRGQMSRQFGKSNMCKVYIDPDLEETFEALGRIEQNRDVARGVPERGERSIISGEIEIIKAGGFNFYLCPSQALQGSRSMFVDTNQEDISIEIFHLMKEIDLPVYGNYESKMMLNGYTTVFNRPELHAWITGIGEL